MEASCSQQRCHVKRKGRLGCIEDEQLAPAQPQQCHLVDLLCSLNHFIIFNSPLTHCLKSFMSPSLFLWLSKCKYLDMKFNALTWSETGSSGKYGMVLAHSTMLKSRRAASSQMLSMPMALSGPDCWLYWCPYRPLGYGSARRS